MKKQNDTDAFSRRAYEKLYRSYGPQHWWPGESAWEVMVGAVLVQGTAWKKR